MKDSIIYKEFMLNLSTNAKKLHKPQYCFVRKNFRMQIAFGWIFPKI